MADDKQRLGYTPQIKYTEDYYSDYNPPATTQTSNVSTTSSLAQAANRIDSLIDGLPSELANAIRDIYNPIIDMIYTPFLKDKTIPDKSIQKELIIKINKDNTPPGPNPKPPGGDPDNPPGKPSGPGGGGGDKDPDKPPVNPPGPNPGGGDDKPSIINVQSIYLDNRSIFINVGKYRKLNATIVPSNATDKTVYWSSDDESIATVDQDGNVYGVALGKCSVYARTSDRRKYAKCRVRVLKNGGSGTDEPEKPKPTPGGDDDKDIHVLRVEVEPKYHAMNKYKKVQLTATIYPDNASNKEVIWYSSDTNICTVDEYGVVNSHDEVGQCKIYVESVDTHKKAVCYINVVSDDENPDDKPGDGSHPGPGPNPKPTPGGNPDDDPSKDNPDGSDPDDDDGLWDTDDLPELIVKREDIRDVIENEFIRNISDLLDYYFNRLIKQLSGYYYNNLSALMGLDTPSVKKLVGNIEDLTVKLDSQHLKDLALRQEKISNVKLSFFENNFNVHQTTRHIQSFLVTYELKKRYVNIQFGNSKTNEGSLSNTVLKGARQSYDKQYEDTYIDLFKYLNSSIKISDDLFDEIARGYKMKELMIKKGGTR
jgi:uncharacterized protein YjdB